MTGLRSESGEPGGSSRSGGFDRDLLESLYRRATGNRTSRGAQAWCAKTLGKDPRTVRRWLTGETESRPTARQLVRLRIAARIGEQRRARARGAGWLERLRALFGRVVEREVIERHRDQEDSALHNPFRWVSWEAFRAARRRAGLPTRRRPPERWRRR